LGLEARPAPKAVALRATSLARLANLRKPPRVMVHPKLREPCLCGLFRPLILLPDAWLAECPSEMLDAILAHELAHAQRLDHVVNLAQRLVEALLFFSPAVHWLSRSLRHQREFCADALAVRLTRDPLALATALESIARLRLTSPAPLVLGPALSGQSVSLLPRIQELLGMKPFHSRPRLWPLAALPAAGFVALIATASGLSQDLPAPGQPQNPARIPRTYFSDNFSVTSPESAAPSGPPTNGQALANPDRQISYEIRCFSLDANPWREALKDRLRPIKQDVEVCCWIIDDRSMSDLINLAQKDPRSNLVQAPKPTTFENGHVVVGNRHVQKYVSQVEKVETADRLGFRPIVKEYELGSRIDLVGSHINGGAAITVELRDCSLLNLHTLVRRETFRDQAYAAEYQVPTTIDRNCRVACDVPDDSALLISLGLHERRGRLSDAGETASGLLEAVGLPPVPARPVTCERLVMIKARRILLDDERRPFVAH
jgi:hypothetical protein